MTSEHDNVHVHENHHNIISYYTRLSEILNAIPQSLIIVNQNGNIVMTNTQTSHLFGYDDSELLEKKIEHLIPERFRHRHIIHRGKYSKNPKTRLSGIGMDLFALKKNGTEFPVEISLAPIQMDTGLFTIASVIDISIRQDLIQKEALIATAMNWSVEAVIAIDLQGRVILWNKGSEKLYGYNEQEIRNKSLKTIVPESKLSEFDNILYKVKHGEHIIQLETQRIHKNGKIIPVSITSSPILSTAGKALGSIGIVRDISRQKKIEEKLKYVAEHDSLTGLINRVLINDRIEQGIVWSKRHKNNMAVFFLDIDDFKQINDNYGHSIGDKLLVGVSERLSNCLRETDSIGRIGGDEFVIIFLELISENISIKIIQKITQCFMKPFDIDNIKITITFSIGISFYPKHGGLSLIEKADAAMYYVKKNGKNNFKLYDEIDNQTHR